MSEKFFFPYSYNLCSIKNIFRVFIITLFLLSSHLAISKNISSTPFSLQIDFSQNSTTNQKDYQAYMAEHEINNSFVPQTYTIGETTITIDAEWPSGTSNKAKQMIDRGAIDGNAYSNLLRDWIGTDGRSSKVPMTLTISGLPAGLYEWKSYHHDPSDQTGLFSAIIEDATGGVTHSAIDISNGNLPLEKVTAFETLLKSDGSDIILSFKNDTYPDNSTSFFLMNGFELNVLDTSVVPEKVDLLSPSDGAKSVSVNPKLDWNNSYFAMEYKVYLSATNPPQLLETVGGSEYRASSLDLNTTYYWSVEAVNDNGASQSEIRSFTTVDSSIFSKPFELQVDFSRSTSPVQSAFHGYFAVHEKSSSFVKQSYEVSGKLVTVDVEWLENTDTQAKQMIDRSENEGNDFSDLLRDWIGTDGQKAQVPLTLTISGIPAGKYEWESYHHDFSNQAGIFSAEISDANGTSTHSAIGISAGNLPLDNVTKLKTIIESDGSDVVFSFEMDAYAEVSVSFFVMNGFVLTEMDTTIIPEKVELLSPLNGLKHLSLNPELKWNESYYANEYKVYLSTDNPPQFLATVENPAFLATTLTSNTKYYWCVEAANNNVGVKSEVRSFTTKDVNSGGGDNEIELNFSHERRFYDEGFGLGITSNYSDLNIIYTTDCSTPSISNGTIYENGIQIDSTTVVKAIAISANQISGVYTHSFLFPDYIKKQSKNPEGFPDKWGGKRIIDGNYEMDPEIINHPDYEAKIESALKSIPSLSLTMSIDDWFNHSSGLYIGYPNTDVTHEKAVTAEFLFQDKENIAIECGVQNQGGTSIVNWKVPKQSMRLMFKEMYGPTRLRQKLFPDSDINSINTLVVDGFLYGWVHPSDSIQWETSLFFRDQLAADMHKDMGQLSFHGMYVHLFINGLYWGMYDLHERPDDAFLSEYLDGEREDYEILKHNKNNVVQGTNEFYLEMLEAARAGLSTDEGLKAIQKYLDLPAFIDYIALNFYLGNYDWAHQNWYAARNKTENGTFKYFVWDAEHVMRYSNISYNSTLKNNSGGPTEIHTLLKENKEYRLMFADAVYKHFYNDGALSIENFEQRFLHRKNEIEEAVILESARWGDYREEKSETTFTLNDHWLPEVNKVLDEYIPHRRDTVIKQLRDPRNLLFPECMPPVFELEEFSLSDKHVTLEHSNLMDGDIYFTIDGSDPRQKGGIISGIKYSEKIRMNTSTRIKARFYSKNDDTWSALAEKTFLFEDVYGEHLVINEIMYHPKDGYPEFIEIINTGESFVDMNGFYLDKGIEFNFSDVVIQPGAGIVLSDDTVLFRNSYDFSAYGQYQKRLSNKGETILLKNNFHALVDSVSYSDSIPWPEDADGDGYSLELIDTQMDNALAKSWESSSEKHGTPFHPETQLELETVLYPNPFKDKITISIRNQSLAFDSFEIEIYNQLGGKVDFVKVESYGSNIELDMSRVAQGLYFIHVKPTSQTEFKRTALKAVKM